MCTAFTYCTKNHYFGRTLDNDCSYGEEITITPRHYPFRFRDMGIMNRHYAMIGMAFVIDNCPLYYDGVNEKGLGMAGLNFIGNACYGEEMPDRDNIAPFEFIPWVLGQCSSVEEARKLLKKIHLIAMNYSEELPYAKLHWIIADGKEAITVESVKEGLKIYDNPVGVLTNNPTFDIQMFNLNNYMQLSAKPPVNHFSQQLELNSYSLGMGALGLPGDMSSTSRFVRVAFTKLNSVCGDSEAESVSQFFHIMESVNQTRGCVELDNGKYETTMYTSCCNLDRGIYYYTTYENRQITAVDMHRENLDGCRLVRYVPIRGEQIRCQN